MSGVRVARRLDGIGISLTRQMFENAPPGAINLALGEPMFDTAEQIVSSGHGALDDGRLPYTSNAGLPELRTAIAAEAPGSLKAESVCVTVGATGALLGALFATVDPGDEVLVPDPGFPAYAAIASIAGAQPIRYPIPSAQGFRFSADSLQRFVTERTRAIVINTPSNPTGHVIPRAELERVAEVAEQHDLTVISDEVYREIYFGDPPASFLDVSEEGLVVYSLSKTESMTGWRLGWVVGPPELIRAVTVINQYTVTCAPTLAQRAALEAFGPTAIERARDMRAEFDRKRRLLTGLIDNELGLPYVDPEGAFFVLVEAAPRGNSLDVARDVLQETGVITVPGTGFGHQAARFLRLSFSATEDEIREGLRRLGGYRFEAATGT